MIINEHRIILARSRGWFDAGLALHYWFAASGNNLIVAFDHDAAAGRARHATSSPSGGCSGGSGGSGTSTRGSDGDIGMGDFDVDGGLLQLLVLLVDRRSSRAQGTPASIRILRQGFAFSLDRSCSG